MLVVTARRGSLATALFRCRAWQAWSRVMWKSECWEGLRVEVSTGAPRQDALPGQQGNPRGPDLLSGDQGREDGQSGPPGGGVGGGRE